MCACGLQRGGNGCLLLSLSLSLCFAVWEFEIFQSNLLLIGPERERDNGEILLPRVDIFLILYRRAAIIIRLMKQVESYLIPSKCIIKM